MKQIDSSRIKSRKKVLIIASAFLLLIALILIATLIYKLPSGFTRFDATNNPVHDVSSTTVNFISGLDEDVTIYWLCPYGVPSESMSYFLLNYADASDHISLVMVDTIEHPDFAQKYTASTLDDYSLIVESDQRFYIIQESSLYYYVNEFVDSQMGSTYPLTESQYLTLYEQFKDEMSGTKTIPYFQGEAYLTAAIDYVTQDYIPHPYVLTGHGNITMSPTLLQMWDMYGLTADKLSLEELSAVPEDASMILLFSPTEDLSDKETQLLTEYIQSGGSFLLVSGPDSSSFANLASVCALFGMHPTDGVVVDPQTDAHLSNQTNVLVPLIYSKHAITYTAYSSGLPAYIPNAMAITVDETLPDGVSASLLFATSTSAYRVSEDSAKTPLCKPSSQYIATCAILTTETDDGIVDPAYFAWFASGDAFTDTAAALSQGGNYQYLLSAATWMHAEDQFTSKYATLNAVDISEPILENLSSTSAILVGISAAVLLPLALMVIGVAIWLKRRSR